MIVATPKRNVAADENSRGGIALNTASKRRRLDVKAGVQRENHVGFELSELPVDTFDRFYPISNIDSAMDLHGNFGEIELPVDPLNCTTANLGKLKSFIHLLIGIIPASLFYSSKELCYFLSNWAFVNHLDESLSLRLDALSIDDIFRLPYSFRFLVKNAGLPDDYAGNLGVKMSNITENRIDRQIYSISDNDLFVLNSIVTNGSVSFQNVLDELYSRNLIELCGQLRNYYAYHIVWQLAFLNSIGLCIGESKLSDMHNNSVIDHITQSNIDIEVHPKPFETERYLSASTDSNNASTELVAACSNAIERFISCLSNHGNIDFEKSGNENLHLLLINFGLYYHSIENSLLSKRYSFPNICSTQRISTLTENMVCVGKYFDSCYGKFSQLINPNENMNDSDNSLWSVWFKSLQLVDSPVTIILWIMEQKNFVLSKMFDTKVGIDVKCSSNSYSSLVLKKQRIELYKQLKRIDKKPVRRSIPRKKRPMTDMLDDADVPEVTIPLNSTMYIEPWESGSDLSDSYSSSDDDFGDMRGEECDEDFLTSVWSSQLDCALLKEFLRYLLLRRHQSVTNKLLSNIFGSVDSVVQYGVTTPTTASVNGYINGVSFVQLFHVNLDSYLSLDGPTSVMDLRISVGMVKRILRFVTSDAIKVTNIIRKFFRTRLQLLLKNCTTIAEVVCTIRCLEINCNWLIHSASNTLFGRYSKVGMVVNDFVRGDSKLHSATSELAASVHTCLTKLLQNYFVIAELMCLQKQVADNNNVNMNENANYYTWKSIELFEAEIKSRIAIIDEMFNNNLLRIPSTMALIELINLKYVILEHNFFNAYGHYYVLTNAIWQLLHTQLSIEFMACLNTSKFRSSSENYNENVRLLNSNSIEIPVLALKLCGSILEKDSVVLPTVLVNAGNECSNILMPAPYSLGNMFGSNNLTQDSYSKICTGSNKYAHSGAFGSTLNKFKCQLEVLVCNKDDIQYKRNDVCEENCIWYDYVAKQRIVSIYQALVCRILAVLMNKPGLSVNNLYQELPIVLPIDQLQIMLDSMVADKLIYGCKSYVSSGLIMEGKDMFDQMKRLKAFMNKTKIDDNANCAPLKEIDISYFLNIL